MRDSFNLIRMRYLIAFFLLSMVSLTAQTVSINEVMSSNSVYLDEDGDTPDWLELHNYGSEDVSISGWSLSDDVDELDMWTFPDIMLAPDEYLLVWASKKDRSEISYFRTLINQGDTFQYLIPTSEPSSSWTAIDFDDSGWSQGASGFGYSDGDDFTIIPSGTQSVYLRKNFIIDDLDGVTSVILDMDYDDAFVAYINGIEVARANINGVPPAYDSGTIQDHEAQMYSGGNPDRFLIENYENILILEDDFIFDENKKYPLLMFQYSGPGSQKVVDKWHDCKDYWHQLLSQKNVVIACVDGRGTGFKGRDFKKITQKELGKYEVEDQIATAKKLAKLSFIDRNRIGIWGWSYGGFMSTNCLLKGNDIFSTAIAVAPVTSWRFYDTVYTERYMQTPQENPSGYDDNSPINYADQLKGNYLLVHGTGDDNVHIQNSMRMINALIEADKPFEIAMYPDRAHGIRKGKNTQLHLYKKMTAFLEKNLINN